jgi:hypothetical protein
LQPQRDSLTYLELDSSTERDFSPSYGPFSIGSLVDLKHLTKLSIDEKVLLNQHNPARTDLSAIRPPSLEIFELRFVTDDFVDLLLGLASRTAAFPRLEPVTTFSNIYVGKIAFELTELEQFWGLDEVHQEAYVRAGIYFHPVFTEYIDEFSTATDWNGEGLVAHGIYVPDRQLEEVWETTHEEEEEEEEGEEEEG